MAKSDIFIAHYKINGRLDWLSQIEGNGNDLTNTNCLLKKNSSELIVAGTFEGEADFQPGLLKYILKSQSNNSDIFLASYQLNGTLNWVRTFPSDSGYDKITSLDLDRFSNILACGYFTGNISIKLTDTSMIYNVKNIEDNAKIFFTKFNEANFNEFFSAIGNDSAKGFSKAMSISPDKNNNIVVSGQFFGNKVNFASEQEILMSDESNGDGFITKYTSSGQFWIETVDTAKLYLIQPNGSEKLQAETIYQIKWFSEYVDSITIDFSADDGKNWTNLVENYPANKKYFNWLVPNILSKNCRIKIYDPTHLKRIDISSANFEITDKKLQITYPIGGEVFKGKQKSIITWNSNKVNFLNIYFSSDNGSTWKSLAMNLPNDKNYHNWTVPNVNSDKCLIKIVDRTDETIFDLNDSVFTIDDMNDSIKILTPDGLEQIAKNRNFIIKFISNDIRSVKIDLINDSLKFSQSIDKNYSVKDGTNEYNWFVSDSLQNSDKYKIMITSLQDSSTKSVSKSYFSIYTDTYINELQNFNCFDKIKLISSPTENNFTLQIENNFNDLSVRIYNSLGIQLKNCYYKSSDAITVDLSGFASGIYFIQINNGNCYKLLKIIK